MRYWLEMISFCFVMILCIMIYVVGWGTLHKCKKVTYTVDAVDAVCSGDSMQWTQWMQ